MSHFSGNEKSHDEFLSKKAYFSNKIGLSYAMIRYIVLFLTLISLNSCRILSTGTPQPKREFRGVWIATVVNIDWPKNGNDSSEKQKADYLEILKFYKDLNYNAVIVQVRAAGDAFYPSEYVPWSRFLSGTEGKRPDWEEDTLTWMIREAHKNGMEFHAWFNPYRATFDLRTDILSPAHDYFTHPEWMLKYGKKYYYNPGLPEVRDKFSIIIAEVVSRYDIDAVHFDDYFYPYKIKGETLKDTPAYSDYRLEGQSLEDWRRSNIDSLVKNVSKTIKTIKPWVRFGISPFGVWKNKTTDPRGSDTKAGQTTYEDLYADPLLWMEKGWVDYIAPQVYWSMDLPVASHHKIMDWWSNNSKNTHLYIGNGAYKIRNNSDVAWERKKELPDQIKLARQTREVSGNILFSAKSLMDKNPDVASYLKRKYYKFPALPPVSPHIEKEIPNLVQVVPITKNNDSIQLKARGLTNLKNMLVYKSGKKVKAEYSNKKMLAKIAIEKSSDIITIPTAIIRGKRFAITFLDNYGRETQPIVLHLNKIP
ncbi:glycoside hydrolase family 10 protein [Maribacter sp. 2304DJ31-5]|uniref:glycoside hydrolase family 10 protein n=1 Tax=Maribacter sp. 2304DJ31-5 TaxID=3386273 RepID=UPI0039BC4214